MTYKIYLIYINIYFKNYSLLHYIQPQFPYHIPPHFPHPVSPPFYSSRFSSPSTSPQRRKGLTGPRSKHRITSYNNDQAHALTSRLDKATQERERGLTKRQKSQRQHPTPLRFPQEH